MSFEKALFPKKCVDLADLEREAKHSRSETKLQKIAQENFSNSVISMYVAGNAHCNTATLELLATHKSESVRLLVAEQSFKIKSNKVLLKLCYDTARVRESLAKRVADDGIITLLLRMNKQNQKIVKICLQRIRNMERISNFLTSTEKNNLSMYLDDILENQYLTEVELKLILEKDVDLSAHHVMKIQKHRGCSKTILRMLEEKSQ